VTEHELNRESARNLAKAGRILSMNPGDVWAMCMVAQALNGSNAILQAEARRIVDAVFPNQAIPVAATPSLPEAPLIA
jgi:hypothetical protein